MALVRTHAILAGRKRVPRDPAAGRGARLVQDGEVGSRGGLVPRPARAGRDFLGLGDALSGIVQSGVVRPRRSCLLRCLDARIIWLVCAQHADDATRDQKWTAEMKRRNLDRGKVAEPVEAAEKEAADLTATRLFNGRESIEVL